jgi:hypothetical protein
MPATVRLQVSEEEHASRATTTRRIGRSRGSRPSRRLYDKLMGRSAGTDHGADRAFQPDPRRFPDPSGPRAGDQPHDQRDHRVQTHRAARLNRSTVYHHLYQGIEDRERSSALLIKEIQRTVLFCGATSASLYWRYE